MRLTYHVRCGSALRGQLQVPGDKSISHRSLMLGAIAEGVTRVSGFLEGEDTFATAKILRILGTRIDRPGPQELMVHGGGMQGFKPSPAVLDCGNSGTSMRLLCGLLVGQNFSCELTGDASLRRRPMRRVADPLAQMGAIIEMTADGRPPLRLRGVFDGLHGIDYQMPIASAQVKSAVLLAGLYAEGRTRVTELAPTRDHTERMLATFGYAVERNDCTVCVEGRGKLSAAMIEVPADISSAAFFMVGASIAPGSDILLEKVGVNPTRTGVIDILRRMGADITLLNERVISGEPIADIRVRYAGLRGIEIPREWVSLAIDEFPAIFIAAANAEGTTVLTGAAELRVKESDRIGAMAEGLRALGVAATPTEEGICIKGGEYHGGVIDSRGDHRVAMAFAMAALRARDDIRINDCANVATSFPGFADLASTAGLKVEAA